MILRKGRVQRECKEKRDAIVEKRKSNRRTAPGGGKCLGRMKKERIEWS